MDLLDVLPDFDIKPYTHLLHSLTKKSISTHDLATKDPQQIARSCPLPSADVQKLAKDVILALQRDVLQGVRKKRKFTDSATEKTDNGLETKKSKTGTRKEESNVVRTLDAALDKALNGGIHPGVTEIVGESSVGKTQFVLGLLLSVQLLGSGNMRKHAIYIGTEGALNTTVSLLGKLVLLG